MREETRPTRERQQMRVRLRCVPQSQGRPAHVSPSRATSGEASVCLALEPQPRDRGEECSWPRTGGAASRVLFRPQHDRDWPSCHAMGGATVVLLWSSATVKNQRRRFLRARMADCVESTTIGTDYGASSSSLSLGTRRQAQRSVPCFKPYPKHGFLGPCSGGV